jgi:hypothetical protein
VPTVAAIGLLVLALPYVTTLIVDGLGWTAAAGLGLTILALAAAHRRPSSSPPWRSRV